MTTTKEAQIRARDTRAGEDHHFANRCCKDRRYLLGELDRYRQALHELEAWGTSFVIESSRSPEQYDADATLEAFTEFTLSIKNARNILGVVTTQKLQ